MQTTAKVRFRCPSCGEETLRSIEWSGRHGALPCDDCGGFIDLTSEENHRATERARLARDWLASKD